MADTLTVRVEAAPQSTKREQKPRPGSEQKTHLTVPAAPAGLAALNTATIAGVGLAGAGGSVVWVAGGLAAAGAGAIVRRYKRRKSSENAAGGSSKTGATSASNGRSGATTGGSAAGGRRGTSAASRAAGPGGGGSSQGGGTSAARRRGILGLLASRRRAKRRSATGGESGGGSAAGGRKASATGRSTSGKRGPLQAGAAYAARAARKAGAALKAGGSGSMRKAGSAAGSIAGAVKRRRARAWKRRQGAGAGAVGPCHKAIPLTKGTKGKVDDPQATPAQKTPPVVIRPAKIRGEEVMARGNGAPTASGGQAGGSTVWHAAKAFWDACSTYKPRGNLEVRAEAWELASSIALLADGIHVRAQANNKENLDPALSQLYATIATNMQSIAQAAKSLGPGFDAMHDQLVKNLLVGNNPAGWDSSNNGRG